MWWDTWTTQRAVSDMRMARWSVAAPVRGHVLPLAAIGLSPKNYKKNSMTRPLAFPRAHPNRLEPDPCLWISWAPASVATSPGCKIRQFVPCSVMETHDFSALAGGEGNKFGYVVACGLMA